jgi:RNA polymerase sigma factor (sigma-70 family)
MVEAFSDMCEPLPGSPGTAWTNDQDERADDELLRLYRETREAEAFSEIVRRHRPMVLRTCLRLAGNLHDAEDAAQSVFLALAARPEVVRRSLPGCLHGLARAAVSELCRSRRRRREREEVAARLNSLFGRLRGRHHPMENQELREELDAALAQLPDRLQQAVILRYLEGHSQRDAARHAGCTQVTMGWRSMKGLHQLRTILSRRGAVVTTGTLLALLNAEAQATAALIPAGAAPAVSTVTATRLAAVLVRQALAGHVARKAALVAVLVTATLGLGAGVVFLPQTGKDTPAAPEPAPPTPEPAPRRASGLGVFERSQDIGEPRWAGAARFTDNLYSLQGGGEYIYRKADQFRFVYRAWTGDGEISACVGFDPDQKARQVHAGVMFRDNLSPGSRHLALLLSTEHSNVKYRTKADQESGCEIARLGARGKHWVRLVRRGNKFTAFVRLGGTPTWNVAKELELALAPSLFVGLAVTAHDNAQLATATFDHVAVRREPDNPGVSPASRDSPSARADR